tara:strand:+ start:349 stop:1503 length:1155 start_codon:yes stop_codon:yes gene_type:complete
MSQIDVISNPFHDDRYTAKINSDECIRFHQSFPDYAQTPLIDLDDYSKELNLNSFQIKDESKRFKLNAFKPLGASYAMAKIIFSKTANDQTELEFNSVIKQSDAIKGMTFATATDGNHGRAVAWCAEKFGCKAIVFLPKDTSRHRVEAIESHGAKAFVTNLNYDETVEYAAKMSIENNWILIQDTSWVGYESIPSDIMIGYQTIIHELQDSHFNWPTHVVMQAGVGSFAASIFDAFSSIDQPRPKFILVEPSGAACYFQSIKIGDGKPHSVEELDTQMAGLCCGTPSILAWDIIKEVTDFFAVCDDSVAFESMMKLSRIKKPVQTIVSGESGAVTIGFIEKICTDKKYLEYFDLMGLDESSNVFCISTEGDTNPDLYNRVVNDQ